MSIHVSTDDQNVLDKGRYLFIKGSGVRFITGIGWTIARDDCCSVVAVKCSTHNTQLDSFYAI